jgi:hypothetical protein
MASTSLRVALESQSTTGKGARIQEHGEGFRPSNNRATKGKSGHRGGGLRGTDDRSSRGGQFQADDIFRGNKSRDRQLGRMMQSEAAIKDKAAPDELRRISQLRDYSINLNSPKAYFRAADDKLSNPHKRKFFVALECELQGLDAEAWAFLKNEALPRLKATHSTRGWQQLFDTLNEAKGYNCLARIGCKDIKFIPRATTDKVQTPDLRGFLHAAPVLCEVKTINVSEVEADRLATGGVGTTRLYLEKEFFDKLSSVIHTAARQLLSFDKDLTSRRIVYVVFNFDDRLHECADKYQKQIEAFIAGASLPNVEVVLEIKPPFHSAV